MSKMISVPVADYLRLRDCETNIETFYDEGECEKGRLIQSGFICPHCGSDSPKTNCKGKSYEELASQMLKDQ